MDTTMRAPTQSPELVELEPHEAAVTHISGAPDELRTLLGDAFEATMQHIAISGAQVAGPPFARYLSFEPRIEAEVGFPYIGTLTTSDRVRQVTLPGGRTVLMTHVGPYEEIAAAWGRVSGWASEHGLVPSSPAWESYLTGPDDPGAPVTQIVRPVR